MKTKANKLLEILKTQDSPLSVSEIHQMLDDGGSERTIRRALAKLIEQGEVIKEGEYRATKYKIKEKEPSTDESASIFSLKSQRFIERVRMPLFQREPCSYNEDWLEAYAPNKTFYLSNTQRQHLSECGEHFNKDLPAGTYARKIYNRLLIDLSYNSSRLEGNTYSLIETELLLIEGKEASGKLDGEKLMIINHKEAIRFLVEGINKTNIKSENIKTLHFLLAEDLVPLGEAGNIRQSSIRVSVTTYIPIDNYQRLQKNIEKIIQKANEINNPYEQSFFLLLHIAYLQAFIDVNKRTSRLAANIPLLQKNLIPLSFNDVDKDDYLSAVLISYEFNEVGPLVELYTSSYIRSAKLYKATMSAIEIDVDRALYRNERRQIIAEVVNQLLVGKQLVEYVNRRSEELILNNYSDKFIRDVLEDIGSLEEFKIVGMGISLQAFQQWQKLSRK